MSDDESESSETSLPDVVVLKSRKTRAKTAFTRARREFLATDRPNEGKLDAAYDECVEIIEALTAAYQKEGDATKVKATMDEMDVLERDYSQAFRNVPGSRGSTSEGRSTPSPAPPALSSTFSHIRKVSVPTFSGEKRAYASWKATFMACIDSATVSDEYKLLQLRQSLDGEALKVIEGLGHSAAAYNVALQRLERKFGGSRRQVALYLEELSHFKPVRDGNAKDLENLSYLLDVAVANLTEAGRESDLGDGALYIELQKKLPEKLLTDFHRWVTEVKRNHSVFSLREYILKEAEYQTTATEAIHGVQPRRSTSHRV